MSYLIEFKQSQVTCADSQQGIYLKTELDETEQFWNGKGIEAFTPFANLVRRLFTTKLRPGFLAPTVNILADESLDQVSMVAMDSVFTKLNYRVNFLDKFAILSTEINKAKNVLGVLELEGTSVKFWIDHKLHSLVTRTDLALNNIVSELSLKSGLELTPELVKSLIAAIANQEPAIYLSAKNPMGELVVWQPEIEMVKKTVESAYVSIAKQLAGELRPLLSKQEGVVPQLPQIVAIGTTGIYLSLLKRLEAELGIAVISPAYPEVSALLAAVIKSKKSRELRGYRLNKLDIF